MGRRILYRIEDPGNRSLSDGAWEEIQRLQHWYNSEFSWTAGRLAFKRYVMFPNVEEFSDLDDSFWIIIRDRRMALEAQGLPDSAIVRQLEKDRLVTVKWGGYTDDCLASGYTRVADNEWNAFLVCDFLLKASAILSGETIHVVDEGRFVRFRDTYFRGKSVYVDPASTDSGIPAREIVREGHVFAIVNREQYDRHPRFRNVVPEFNRLGRDDRIALLHNWNWLGYSERRESAGHKGTGYDLNRKVKSVGFLPVPTGGP